MSTWLELLLFSGEGGFWALLGVNGLMWAWVLLRPTHVVRVSRLHVRGGRGLALPGLILLAEGEFSEAALRHEFTHIRQMQGWSPLGVALLLGGGYAWLFCRFAWAHRRLPRFVDLYMQHPLEREAFRAMDEGGEIGPLIGEIPAMTRDGRSREGSGRGAGC